MEGGEEWEGNRKTEREVEVRGEKIERKAEAKELSESYSLTNPCMLSRYWDLIQNILRSLNVWPSLK